jgi:hypothetical protein
LARTFRGEAQTMPRARLGDGSWQFEGDKLAALRAKIKAGNNTLGEVYGPPLYGIKTGLNEAFVVSRETRDELVARDMRSAELLAPFIRADNIKRWRVESEDLFLINIPRGKVLIDDYPAIRDHLLPFKPALEARATKQQWFELQQAQLAYQGKMRSTKIAMPDMSQGPKFAFDESGSLCGNTVYFVPSDDFRLLALANSRLAWLHIFGEAEALRGGKWRLRMFAEDVATIPIPETASYAWTTLSAIGKAAASASDERTKIIQLVLKRVPDLCPPGRAPKLTNRLRQWWKLDFKSFRAEIKKAFKDDIPLKQRNDWESLLREEGEKIRCLTAEIEQAEREIDSIVYKLFNLTSDEIALLESSLAGQY